MKTRMTARCLHLLLLPALLLPTGLLRLCSGLAAQSLAQLAAETQAKFAPDRRVARFDVEAAGIFVRGETTSAAARAYLLKRAADLRITCIDQIALLPAAALGPDTLGLVRQSVANLRTEPRHAAELATQALMGTPLRVLKQQGDWYLVQTPDQYIAWIDSGGLTLIDDARMSAWKRADRLVFTGNFRVLLSPDGLPVADLVAGAIVEKIGCRRKSALIKLPDGQEAELPLAETLPLTALTSGAMPLTSALTATASSFLGRPYLWGGSSGKGLDCSGFTRTVYFLHGFIIPRDASQQVYAGEEVPLDSTLSNLLPGDFVFFGNYRNDGSLRINHVGLYLGQGQFIHSGADNGCVKVQSLLPGALSFAPHRRASLMRARRLRAGTRGVVGLGESGWY